MKKRVSLLLVAVVAGMQGDAFGGDWNLIDLGTLGGSETLGYGSVTECFITPDWWVSCAHGMSAQTAKVAGNIKGT
jgi:hypothetical protein